MPPRRWIRAIWSRTWSLNQVASVCLLEQNVFPAVYNSASIGTPLECSKEKKVEKVLSTSAKPYTATMQKFGLGDKLFGKLVGT